MDVKILAFDTGGTILDWHSSISAALAEAGQRYGVTHDWASFTNEYRRRALRRMINAVDPLFNIDDVHRDLLDELLADAGITAFTAEDRAPIASRWHALNAWPDFVPALERLKQRHVCVSFTILSLALVIAVSRRNGIAWDAVIACEMLQVYKTRPEAYQRAAQLLQTPPGEILMVACHNFDLDAARGEGYRTAFVRRPDEWGTAGPPDPTPNPACDIVVDGFAELADRLAA
ncbi:MAG TPA: haloacid dehalogenase type II [Stellaceae bacterium]|jgi:2-haloacid dehalogenase|nr:haloacid dehalogenase type II [Stellaceae bacterium]